MTKESPIIASYLDEILANKFDNLEYPDKTQPSHLRWMLKERLLFTDNLKSNRWLGFVQGVMASRGWLDVDAERDRTRPYFTN